MAKQVLLLAALFILASSGCRRAAEVAVQRTSVVVAQEPRTSSLSLPYPAVQSVSGKRTLTCLALMEADLTGSPTDWLTKGIEGKVTSGKNAVRLTFGDDATVLFFSDAGARASETQGARFNVIADDAAQLVGSFFDGQSLSGLVINKKTGLAIWSKIRSDFPVYDAPTGGLSYLACR